MDDQRREPTISPFAPAHARMAADQQNVQQPRQVERAVSQPLRVDEREEVKNTIAKNIRWMPLRTAVEQAEEITKLPDYKADVWPNKIELAMILNAWSYTRGED